MKTQAERAMQDIDAMWEALCREIVSEMNTIISRVGKVLETIRKSQEE